MSKDTEKGERANSVQEVCRRCGFGHNTFYENVRSGDLIARKMGRKTIVLETDLLAFLNAQPVLDLNDEAGKPQSLNPKFFNEKPLARKKRQVEVAA